MGYPEHDNHAVSPCHQEKPIMNMSMNMTHYMELLSSNQPWNLILFMAVPVILAEYIAITELQVLFTRNFSSPWRSTNHYASIAAGFYFLGVFLYLLVTAVIPLTTSGGWRGPADVIAVGFYLLGVVPLGGMALLELGVIGRGLDPTGRLKQHAIFVAIFLVVAHVAMIFGMLNPTLL
jgi:hypothetical protein